MSPVFADTFYWYALSNPRDQWHPYVLEARKKIGKTPIITTDEVLIEYASAMASDGNLRAAASILIGAILRDPGITVIPQTRGSFITGLDLYRDRPDKKYSLVDCISMSICRTVGISDILTNDHHFEQEGFTVLIKQ